MNKYLVPFVAVLILSAPSFARDYEAATAGPAQQVNQPAPAATALRVSFDDTGFDYYGKKEGFIQLRSDASGLVLHLKEAATPQGVWYAFEKVDELSRKDHNRIYQAVKFTDSFVVQRRAQTEEAKRLRNLVNVTQRPAELSVFHQQADLEPVLNGYLAGLAALGFEVQAAEHAPNVRVYLVSKDARQAKFTFTRLGDDVRVRIVGFSS